MQLLDIRNLTLELETPDGLVRAVDRVNLSLKEGEIRGLVGESGSGKSLIAKAIMVYCTSAGKYQPTVLTGVARIYCVYLMMNNAALSAATLR